MKQLLNKTQILLILTLLAVGSLYGQQNNNMLCRIGLEYQLSYNENWGANRPVILTIEKNSPADKAGLRIGDIIEVIDGQETASLTENEILQRLSQNPHGQVSLEVSNFGYKRQSRTLRPECRSRNIMSERILASAFAFYSLEDAAERIFVYPFDTGRDGTTSLETTSTYAFADEGLAATGANLAINQVISSALEAKGLKYSSRSADLYVDSYYKLVHNPYYDAKLAKEATKEYPRYSFRTKGIAKLPLLPVGGNKQLAPYVLTFGIRIYSSSKLDHIIWSCEATEHLTGDMPIVQYAQEALDIMLMQFPFVRYDLNPRLRMTSRKYTYTGICYDSQDFGLIASVEHGSPAEKAGLKKGDRIAAINGRPVEMPNKLTESYRLFLEKSMQYRAANSAFTDRHGLANCCYWNPEYAGKVARMLGRKSYNSPFSYLFSFRPWVYGKEPKALITFDIVNAAGILQQVSIVPAIVDESYVTLD